jgi:hypothetical protein
MMEPGRHITTARIPRVPCMPRASCRNRGWPEPEGAQAMYTHILLPVDGSETSFGAARHGIALARALHAKVTVIIVTTPWTTQFARELAVVVPEAIVPETEYELKAKAAAGAILRSVADCAIRQCRMRHPALPPSRSPSGDHQCRRESAVRPDRHGLSRQARNCWAAARQRDREGADPQQPPRARLSRQITTGGGSFHQPSPLATARRLGSAADEHRDWAECQHPDGLASE